MKAGLPKYLPVNLKDIEDAGFQEGDEVSLETLKQKGLINPSGRDRKLPLKVNFHYRSLSSSNKFYESCKITHSTSFNALLSLSILIVLIHSLYGCKIHVVVSIGGHACFICEQMFSYSLDGESKRECWSIK